MSQKKIILCTILSIMLIAVIFPATVFGSPRGQMDRQGFSTVTSTPQQPREGTSVPDPAPDPSNPSPSNPAPPSNGGSGSGSYSPSERNFRSGGYVPSTPAPTPPPAPAPEPPPSSPPAEKPVVPGAPAWMTPDEAKAFVLLNEFRIENGLPPVQAHQALTEVARLKAQDMANNNYFDHNSPTYGSPGNMVRQAGIPFSALGENLSGAGNVRQAHAQLVYSTGHRKIMLNPNYNYVGIGIESWKATPGVVLVQLFIRQ